MMKDIQCISGPAHHERGETMMPGYGQNIPALSDLY
jgi:hypothetical protein